MLLEMIGVIIICYISYLAFKAIHKSEDKKEAPVFKNKLAEDIELVTILNTGTADIYSIPEAPKEIFTKARWVPPDETIEIAGFLIAGGMVYVGDNIQTEGGATEPSLINPRLSIANQHTSKSPEIPGYWPSYHKITPETRRRYLKWLAEGRKDPDVDIGYVFLFFYGLERRVLLDIKTDEHVLQEISFIAAEVSRLLSIYSSNNSFRNYASRFLDFVAIHNGLAKRSIYKEEPTLIDYANGSPFRVKLAFGQMAIDNIAVPTNWALAWIYADPTMVHRTPVMRCPEYFKQLFRIKYKNQYKEGMQLKVNRTKLQKNYYPASNSFLSRDFVISFDNIPDVSATTEITKKLQSLVDECAVDLASYSRFIARNPVKQNSMESLLELPPAIWPTSVLDKINELKKKIDNGFHVMKFNELCHLLSSDPEIVPGKIIELSRALASLHVCMEPDVIAGAKRPKYDDAIILFIDSLENEETRTSPIYQAASITLSLACDLANIDGAASEEELEHLFEQVDEWIHLTVAQRKRLKAHIMLQLSHPTSFATLKRKLESLDLGAKKSLTHFMVELAQADHAVTPQEIKWLERIYKLLDIDARELYTDLHSASMAPVDKQTTSKSKSTDSMVQLDPARIAILQKETEQVSSLLATIFAEEEENQPIDQEELESEIEDESITSLLGLDPEHARFLRLLITRSSWMRQELADAADDMELMLDGALEHINEAGFDHFDEPITDGDDPITINQNLLERLTT